MPSPLTDTQLDEIEAVVDAAEKIGADIVPETARALLAEVRRLRAELDDRTEQLASADDPTRLRWGLNDVMWGDDDTITVLLSGPNREPYWLEFDPERAAVLREDLAGPPAEEPAVEPETATPNRILTESEYNRAWHAVEGAAGEEGADPGTVLHAVLDRLGINLPPAPPIHGCPPDGSGLTPCCGRTPFELPRTDRMTTDPTEVTCAALA